MSLTPNYSFIIPTGSDAVNLLTQCYPNFTSLDSILKPIQESGVTPATDTKVGTVHQLVRTDSSCNMFRFIATGNYASGDTFTVDGASVTATAMDGTALPAGAFVINQSVVCILNNLVLTVLIAGKETTSLPASAITYDNTGSGLTAINAQDAIDEVVSMMPTVSDHGVYELWSNPDISQSFGNETVSITTDKTFDTFMIELGRTNGRIEALTSIEAGRTTSASVTFFGGSIARNYQRYMACVYSAGVYTITFAIPTVGAYTYGQSTIVETTDDTELIPYRIFGIVHNN